MNSYQRLWDKGLAIDDQILAFTVGSDYLLDSKLVEHDIVASCAHVKMLAKCRHITDSEYQAIVAGLKDVGREHSDGDWAISLEEEDCHTAIELRLREKVGELAGKMHLGRSRNDQVLVALRLFLRQSIAEVHLAAQRCVDALNKLIAASGEIKIPGYTHMQQAMPSSVALWAGGFASELNASCELLNAADTLSNQCPLGSAAGYGTPNLCLDRQLVATELGFSAVQEPVTACQLSRGKAESAFAFANLQILTDVGRLASDLCLFATQEFGLVKLGEQITTGSSIMPQKRNPDVFELVRGHSAQAQSDLLAILSVTSKMPSGYHRDLQLIKAPLFTNIDRTLSVLNVMAHALEQIEFLSERYAQVADPSIDAAERAFFLVQNEGLSFRAAYQRVASELKNVEEL